MYTLNTLVIMFTSVIFQYLRGGHFQFKCFIKGVFKGGGGSEIFRFFLKSEGKEIERKRKKGMLGGGGTSILTYFWG